MPPALLLIKLVLPFRTMEFIFAMPAGIYMFIKIPPNVEMTDFILIIRRKLHLK